MLAVLQQDLGDDIDSHLFIFRVSRARRQISKDEFLDKNDNQKTSGQHQEQESDTSCCIFTWWSSGGIHENSGVITIRWEKLLLTWGSFLNCKK